MKRPSMLDRLSDIDALIDKNLPEDKQRVELCKILKEEIENLSPNDMADYLEFFGIEFINPGVVIKLKFPVRAHIFNPECADIEADERLKKIEKKIADLEREAQSLREVSPKSIAQAIAKVLEEHREKSAFGSQKEE